MVNNKNYALIIYRTSLERKTHKHISGFNALPMTNGASQKFTNSNDTIDSLSFIYRENQQLLPKAWFIETILYIFIIFIILLFFIFHIAQSCPITVFTGYIWSNSKESTMQLSILEIFQIFLNFTQTKGDGASFTSKKSIW